jgi:hypothetical protein
VSEDSVARAISEGIEARAVVASLIERLMELDILSSDDLTHIEEAASRRQREFLTENTGVQDSDGDMEQRD